jgi:hypothetical protein
LNWFYLIPIICGLIALFIDPLYLLYLVGGLGFIVAASFFMEKVFGPPKK